MAVLAQGDAGFRDILTFAFEANFVECTDAIDGEILQVSFDSVPASLDENERSTPYILISRNFEFPGSARIEWHDGHEYDGGAEIVSVTLSRARIWIELDRELDFDVTFSLPDQKFTKLRSFLKRMIDDRIRFAD